MSGNLWSPGMMDQIDGSLKISFSPSRPPPCYTFVPKGDVYLSRKCRTLSREFEKPLFEVYEKQRKGRLGLHCDSQIFEVVQKEAAASADRREKAVIATESLNYPKNQDLLFAEFPQMPEETALEILGNGFLKGSGRVGRAKVLDEKLRVVLATSAHIRHKHTMYDSILNSLSSQTQPREAKRAARDRVHDQVMKTADSWRNKDTVLHRSQVQSTSRKPSGNPSASLILSRNGARRKGQAGTHLTEKDGKASATNAAPQSSTSAEAPGEDSNAVSFSRETTLELNFENLKLSEGTKVPLRKYQRRRAGIREDLEKLKRNPNHCLTGTRLNLVLTMHMNNGEDIATLGITPADLSDIRHRAKIEKQAKRSISRPKIQRKSGQLQTDSALKARKRKRQRHRHEEACGLKVEDNVDTSIMPPKAGALTRSECPDNEI